MNAMDKIRDLARRKFSQMSYSQIAGVAGVSKNAAYAFMTGKNDSPVMSKTFALKIGGEFRELWSEHLAEQAKIRRQDRLLKIKKAALKKKRILAANEKIKVIRMDRQRPKFAPSDIVPMPQPTPETHRIADLREIGASKYAMQMAGFVL